MTQAMEEHSAAPALEPLPVPESPVTEPVKVNGAAAEPVKPAAETEVGSVDKIRDILFGSQMRDYDRRFARLEERLLKESADLREDTRRRFDTLENFIKSEMAALSGQLKSENQQRDELGHEMQRHLGDLSRTLEKKIVQLDEQNVQAQRELRQQLLDQAKLLSDDLRRNHDELSAALAREADELRHDKTDRATLAELFTEVALRLNNQFKLPGQ